MSDEGGESWEAIEDPHDCFAFEYVRTGSAIGAYLTAYDIAEKRTGHYKLAHQLTQNVRVKQLIEQYRAALNEARAYSLLNAVEELDDAMAVAKASGQASAMVSAIKAKVDLYGLDAPKRVEVGGEVETRVTINDASEFTSAILSLAAKVGNAGDNGEPDTGGDGES